MRSWIGTSLAACLFGGIASLQPAAGQVVERDTKLTGPRGRTIERSIRTERGPGFVDRQVEIRRPHETLIRDTRIQQPGGFGPRPGPPGRPVIVERDVIVERAPILAPFVAPFLSFSFGAPVPPPPPPPVVYVPEPIYVPEPVYVAEPPVVAAPVVVPSPVYVPVPASPAVPAVPPPSPQVADALGRLASFHHQSRRDGCLTLGHLGDPRAVGPLTERLQHDLDREVRTAAAWALGELGDPRAALALERAALYDKRQEVRDAANSAYRRLPKPAQGPATSPPGQPATIISQAEPRPAATAFPAREGGFIDPGPATPLPENPPPFPIPATTP